LDKAIKESNKGEMNGMGFQSRVNGSEKESVEFCERLFEKLVSQTAHGRAIDR
jgi:hypothetical protein